MALDSPGGGQGFRDAPATTKDETNHARAILHRQVSLGSTGPESVAAMIEKLRDAVSVNRQEIGAAGEAIARARQETDEIIQHVLQGGKLNDLEL